MAYPKDAHKRMAWLAGRFLLDAYRATALSRAEAAERAGVGIGYLTGLLAGRAVSPNPETVKNMAEGWGFLTVDFYLAAGILSREDMKLWIATKGLEDEWQMEIPSRLRSVLVRLARMPEGQREAFEMAIAGMLNAAAPPEPERARI